MSSNPVHCGKCGTLNPGENAYRRACGHRLADDVVEPEHKHHPSRQLPPVSPVAGVEIDRYPLVDPEGQEILTPEPSPPVGTAVATPTAPRRGILLWSLGIHLLVLSTVLLVTWGISAQAGLTPSANELQAKLETIQTEVLELNERTKKGELTDEAAAAETQRLFQRHGISQLLMMLVGPVLLGFFLSGVLVGRVCRPTRTLELAEVALAALLVGGLTLCCQLVPWVCPVGFVLTVGGAMLGRRL